MKNDDEEMTVEEAKRRLEEMGFTVGSWENTDTKGEEQVFTIPSFTRQAKALEKVKELLQDQVDKDVVQIAELKEKLNRLQHGGGI